MNNGDAFEAVKKFIQDKWILVGFWNPDRDTLVAVYRDKNNHYQVYRAFTTPPTGEEIHVNHDRSNATFDVNKLVIEHLKTQYGVVA